LPVRVLPPIGAGRGTSLEADVSSGIPADVQRLLAGMRTDLDAFSDIEASSVMLAGYRIARASARALPAGIPTPDERKWAFALASGRMDQPDGAYLRRLRVSRLRFFKPLALALTLAMGAPGPSTLARRVVRGGLTVGGLALVAAIVFLLGWMLPDSSVSALTLYIVVVGLILATLLYLKADTPVLRTVSWMLYDSLVPLLLALFGVLSILSLGSLVEGWVHRGLGRTSTDGVQGDNARAVGAKG